ncbi:MAG: hypothetical protein F6K31_42010 [Symploca sp. SIO2G7]|nr:hypothetical protein [Symploca sp. SIO2G7]
MSNPPVDINQVKQRAATGHFRSIALWLNYPLVPQAIYAQVQSDKNPGYLRILLEFEQSPKKDVLIRLVCHRICRLESPLIRGVLLIGRLVGDRHPVWQQRVRLTKQTVAPSKKAAPNMAPTSTSLQHGAAKAAGPTAEIITTITFGSELLNTVPSYLIPREPNIQERRRRPNRNIVPFPIVQIRPSDIDRTQTSAQRRSQRRQWAPKDVIEQQFKYMRAIIVTGSAAAAFILGCVTESVMSQRGMAARNGSHSLPTLNDGGWRTLSDVEVQEIAYRSATRGSAVKTALESVAVMPHKPATNPENPTVTLMFGAEVPVGDVPLQTPDAVGKVLEDISAFQEADVSRPFTRTTTSRGA